MRVHTKYVEDGRVGAVVGRASPLATTMSLSFTADDMAAIADLQAGLAAGLGKVPIVSVVRYALRVARAAQAKAGSPFDL